MGFSRSGSQISAYSAETNPRKCIALNAARFWSTGQRFS